MPATPRMFAASAQKMAEMGTEIDYRNAASRAYYALYHAALALMLGEFGEIKRYQRCGVHQWLTKHLEEVGQQGGAGKITAELSADLAAVLTLIKRLRTNADYKLNRRFQESDALLSISYAFEYLDRIDNLLETVSKTE